ncbi:MAG: dockerin type I repeat-containing protein [Candidatus Zixiibacteriota bacterium]|nr:MAG: dockerin type I repeat-containing protein [candidate division Zixibacteria bacterium]
MPKAIRFFILTLCLTTLIDSRAPAKDSREAYREFSSVQLIEQAYSAGRISSADRIIYSLQSIYAPLDLPDEFKSEAIGAVRSATPLINLALDNWDILSPEQQAVAAYYLGRPSLELTYFSPEGHFAIHYDTSGDHAVPPEDLNDDDVPDFVERAGLYADSSYRHYHINLGYIPPPSDGDDYYDIYMMNLGHYYGLTVREDPGDSAWNDYSSHVECHCTFDFAQPNEDPEGTVIGALKVTCAHEYFHATQLAYGYVSWPNLWWTEGNAVFFEDEVFEVVNDHYVYLPDFFNYPDTFLIDTGYFTGIYHNYSTFVWTTFLAEKYGIDIIKHVWEYVRYNAPLPSIDSALGAHGETMKSIFPEFTVWNYFTDDRADTIYYDDGVDYPLVITDQVVADFPSAVLTPVNPPDGFASNYIVAYPGTSENGIFLIKFDGANIVEWGLSYILFLDDYPIVHAACPMGMFGMATCGIYDLPGYDSIIFIPSVVSQWFDDNPYQIDSEIHPFGDADGSGEVNILDVSYLVGYLYREGHPPRYAYLSGDADCSGNINLLDVTYIVNYLYRDGPEPCLYRP